MVHLNFELKHQKGLGSNTVYGIFFRLAANSGILFHIGADVVMAEIRQSSLTISSPHYYIFYASKSASKTCKYITLAGKLLVKENVCLIYFVG